MSPFDQMMLSAMRELILGRTEAMARVILQDRFSMVDRAVVENALVAAQLAMTAGTHFGTLLPHEAVAVAGGPIGGQVQTVRVQAFILVDNPGGEPEPITTRVEVPAHWSRQQVEEEIRHRTNERLNESEIYGATFSFRVQSIF